MNIEVLHDNGPDDRDFRIYDRHTISFGPIYIGDVTHTSRDGLPMEVMYDRTYGYLVAVQTF